MLYVNFGDRTAPRGLQVGKDTRTTFLSVDEGLSKVTHYGIPTDLHRLQVHGINIRIKDFNHYIHMLLMRKSWQIKLEVMSHKK